MTRPNAWYEAICDQLRTAGTPLEITQILQRLESAGFKHGSQMPRSTLSARVAELVQLKRVVHVGPATYQIAEEQGR